MVKKWTSFIVKFSANAESEFVTKTFAKQILHSEATSHFESDTSLAVGEFQWKNRFHWKRFFLVTRTRLELVLPPWKGGVLTAWPTGQKW